MSVCDLKDRRKLFYRNGASERYKTYLELAPDAPDAAFIKSIVK